MTGGAGMNWISVEEYKKRYLETLESVKSEVAKWPAHFRENLKESDITPPEAQG